ncbi:hypothetical protein AN948_03435 [Rhodococcus sp. ADH]|nr:hypothetical protein AN948_03435 [Rhodococcus sp. ADH]RGP46750.1 hypothetical protein AWH04_07825 [Rhodococcus erythropolis]
MGAGQFESAITSCCGFTSTMGNASHFQSGTNGGYIAPGGNERQIEVGQRRISPRPIVASFLVVVL